MLLQSEFNISFTPYGITRPQWVHENEYVLFWQLESPGNRWRVNSNARGMMKTSPVRLSRTTCWTYCNSVCERLIKKRLNLFVEALSRESIPSVQKMQPFYTLFLTHWGRDKWSRFCRWHNPLHFLKWQLLNFHSNCTDAYSGVPMTTSTIGSDNAEQATSYYLLSSEPITAWSIGAYARHSVLLITLRPSDAYMHLGTGSR